MVAPPLRFSPSFPLWKLLWGLLFFCLGCISGGLERRHPQPPRLPLALSPPLFDYAGGFHVHGENSHDSHGTLEEIVESGKLSGCDFLFITDHNNMKLKAREGFHKGLLILVGAEISSRSGHIIALGIPRLPNRDQPVKELFKEIKKMGGMVFLAHPYRKKMGWTGPAQGFQGIEAFSLSTEAKKANKMDLILSTLLLYSLQRRAAVARLVERPREELAYFDSLCQKGHMVMVGAVDAHAIPVPPLGALHLYSHFFPIVRLHLLASKLEKKSLLKALQKGRAYFSFDLFSDATGFLFHGLIRKGKVVMMGDQIAFQKGVELIAQTPEVGRFILYRNGKPIFQKEGKSFRYLPRRPGVYRVEVYTRKYQKKKNTPWKPWIFSNPIWLK